MKRSIFIKHNDNTEDVELNITKAAKVHSENSSFIYLEKMKDGNWRLTFTSDVIDDFSKVESLLVRREDWWGKKTPEEDN